MTDAASPAPPSADVPEDAVRLERDGAVFRVVLHRPDRLNAFAGDMRQRLHDLVAEASAEPECRCIVLTGSGRAFSAGADVTVMEGIVARDDGETFLKLVEAGMAVVSRLASVPQPTVAALNGVAAGAGAALALACDVRIASERARIGFGFGRIGLHPDWGTSFHLPRLIGLGRAKELSLTGRMVEMEEALRIGLVERVVPEERFEEEVRALAAELAARPPLAVSLAKRTLNHAFDRDLDDLLHVERAAQMRCFRSPDVAEGLAAFREKRPARFGALETEV